MILNLTKDDIGAICELVRERKTVLIRLSHEKPKDKYLKNEVAKFKRMHEELLAAFQR